MSDCPLASQYLEFFQEQVSALQGYPKPSNDPFSNTYNPGWRNHPNFSWKPQTSNSSPFTQNQRPDVPNPFNQSSYRSPTPQYQPPPPPSKDSAFQEQVLNILQTM